MVYEKVGLAPPSPQIVQEIEDAELALFAAERAQLIPGDNRVWPSLAGIVPANIQLTRGRPIKRTVRLLTAI